MKTKIVPVLKFHRASKNDANLVTLNLSQLNLERLPKHAPFVVDIKIPRSTYPATVWFVVNRERETASTHSWPKQFPIPEVGKPIYLEVTRVSLVQRYEDIKQGVLA